MRALLNGKLINLNEPALPVTDRGFMLGDGLFETLKVHNSQPVWLPDHYARMENSANFAGLKIPSLKEITKDCQLLIKENSIESGFLRITASRLLDKQFGFSTTGDKTNIAITGGNKSSEDKPMTASFAPWPTNEMDPSIYHKSSSRFSLTLALREMEKSNIDEMVFLNTRGYAAEGVISNIFFIKDGLLKTPSVACGMLEGISRKKVIEVAKAMNIDTLEGHYEKTDLLSAHELFFTNSTSLIRPCKKLEGKEFENSNTTLKLKEALLASI